MPLRLFLLALTASLGACVTPEWSEPGQAKYIGTAELHPAALEVFLVPADAVAACLRVGAVMAYARAETMQKAVEIAVTIARNRAAELGGDAVVYEQARERELSAVLYLDLRFRVYRCSEQSLVDREVRIYSVGAADSVSPALGAADMVAALVTSGSPSPSKS